MIWRMVVVRMIVVMVIMVVNRDITLLHRLDHGSTAASECCQEGRSQEGFGKVLGSHHRS